MRLIIFILHLIIYTTTTLCETLFLPYVYNVDYFQARPERRNVRLNNIHIERIRQLKPEEDEGKLSDRFLETAPGVESTLQGDEDNNETEPDTMNIAVQEPEAFPDPPPLENMTESEERTNASDPEYFNTSIINSTQASSSTEHSNTENPSILPSTTEEQRSKTSSNNHREKDPDLFEENVKDKDNEQSSIQTTIFPTIIDPVPFPDHPPGSDIEESENSSQPVIKDLNTTQHSAESTVNILPDTKEFPIVPAPTNIGREIDDQNMKIAITALAPPSVADETKIHSVPNKKLKDPDPFENIENSDNENSSEKIMNAVPIPDPPPFPDLPPETDTEESVENSTPFVAQLNMTQLIEEARNDRVPPVMPSPTEQIPTNSASPSINNKLILNPEIGKIPPGVEQSEIDSTNFGIPGTIQQSLFKSLVGSSPSNGMEIKIGESGVLKPSIGSNLGAKQPSEGDPGVVQVNGGQNIMTLPISMAPVKLPVDQPNFNVVPRPIVEQGILTGVPGPTISGPVIDHFNPGQTSSLRPALQQLGIAGQMTSGQFGVDYSGSAGTDTSGLITNTPEGQPVVSSNAGPQLSVTPNGGHSSGIVRPDEWRHEGHGHRRWQHGHGWHGHWRRPSENINTGSPTFNQPSIGILIIGNPQFGCSNTDCSKGVQSTSNSNSNPIPEVINWLYSVLGNRTLQTQMSST